MGIFKTKGLLRTKVYFPKLYALVEKTLVKCVACQMVRKKDQNTTLNIRPTHTKKIMDTVNIDFLGPSQISSIAYVLIPQFSLIHDQRFTKYRIKIGQSMQKSLATSGIDDVLLLGNWVSVISFCSHWCVLELLNEDLAERFWV